jgi:hypothetical protein
MIKVKRVKDIGELRHQCSLHQFASSESDTGASVPKREFYPAGDTVTNIWCKFEPFSPSREQLIEERGGRYQTQYFGILTIPFDENVLDREMHCLYDGIYYRIVNKIKYGEAFFFLECVCIGTKDT